MYLLNLGVKGLTVLTFRSRDLAELETVTVQIYKDNETKTKKEKRKLVGECTAHNPPVCE